MVAEGGIAGRCANPCLGGTALFACVARGVSCPMKNWIAVMNSPRGRIFRIALGAELIVIGMYSGGPLGWLVALVGLVPIVPAFFGRCA